MTQNNHPLLKKSILWAFISIPITAIGFVGTFALAHGSLNFLLPFVLPGFLVMWLLTDVAVPSWAIVLNVFLAQYLTYLLLIYGFFYLKKRFTS